MGTLIRNGINYSGGGGGSATPVVDSLASTAVTSALSANMGNKVATSIGPLELGTTSAHAYSEGDCFIWTDEMVKALANIAIGDTLTAGTNVTSTTIAEELTSISIAPATTAVAGIVKPDGDSITVDNVGTIAANCVETTTTDPGEGSPLATGKLLIVVEAE